jgi:hypothetical protein
MILNMWFPGRRVPWVSDTAVAVLAFLVCRVALESRAGRHRPGVGHRRAGRDRRRLPAAGVPAPGAGGGVRVRRGRLVAGGRRGDGCAGRPAGPMFAVYAVARFRPRVWLWPVLGMFAVSTGVKRVAVLPGGGEEAALAAGARAAPTSTGDRAGGSGQAGVRLPVPVVGLHVAARRPRVPPPRRRHRERPDGLRHGGGRVARLRRCGRPGARRAQLPPQGLVSFYAADVERCLKALDDEVPVVAARQVCGRTRSPAPGRRPGLVPRRHRTRQLLVRDGALAAVIDVGDRRPGL